MARHSVDILYRDPLSLRIGRDLVYLRNEPAHKVAAYEYEPLRRVKLNALPGGCKAADYPVRQHPLRLLRELQLFRLAAQRLDEFQPSVRFKLRALHEGHRAVIRYILQQLHALVGIRKLVDIDIAQLHKAALAHKRYRVQRLAQARRVKPRSVHALIAEVILTFRQAYFFQLREILLAQVVLRPPEQVQPLRAVRLELPHRRGIIQFFLVFAAFLSHCPVLSVSLSFRPHRF